MYTVASPDPDPNLKGGVNYLTLRVQFYANECNEGRDANARSKFWGCQGRRTRVGVTTVSNSLILGGWVTKVSKNGDKK